MAQITTASQERNAYATHLTSSLCGSFESELMASTTRSASQRGRAIDSVQLRVRKRQHDPPRLHFLIDDVSNRLVRSRRGPKIFAPVIQAAEMTAISFKRIPGSEPALYLCEIEKFSSVSSQSRVLGCFPVH